MTANAGAHESLLATAVEDVEKLLSFASAARDEAFLVAFCTELRRSIVGFTAVRPVAALYHHTRRV